METHKDNELEIIGPGGDRSLQDRQGGDIVPVPALSSSSHGLSGLCTAGKKDETTTAKKMTEEDPPEVSTATPVKDSGMNEGEGDTYVSSLEELPTPRPVGRPRLRVCSRVAGVKVNTDSEGASPCGKDNVRSGDGARVTLSDTSPEAGVSGVSARGGRRSRVPVKKRKKLESSSEGAGESESQRILRPRGVRTSKRGVRPSNKKAKSAIVETGWRSDEEWSTDEEHPVEEQPEEGPSSSRPAFSSTESASPPALDAEEKEKRGKKMVGRKPFLNKEKVANRLVKDLEEVPKNIDELRDRSTPSLEAMAQRWIDEIDFIKSKCKTMQGPLMKRMSERTGALTKLVQLLSERVQDNGDISFLKKRNIEMTSRVDVYEKEVASLKKEVKELTDLIGELQTKALKAVEEKEKMEACRRYLLKEKRDRSTSPMPQIIESPSVNIYSACNKCSDGTYLRRRDTLVSYPADGSRMESSGNESGKPEKEGKRLADRSVSGDATYLEEFSMHGSLVPGLSMRDVRVELPGGSRPLESGGKPENRKRRLDDGKQMDTYLRTENPMVSVDPEKEKEELIRKITEEVLKQLRTKEDKEQVAKG